MCEDDSHWDRFLQLLPWNAVTEKHSIIVPAVSDEEAKKKFPEGWKALKSYLRLVKQPK